MLAGVPNLTFWCDIYSLQNFIWVVSVPVDLFVFFLAKRTYIGYIWPFHQALEAKDVITSSGFAYLIRFLNADGTFRLLLLRLRVRLGHALVGWLLNLLLKVLHVAEQGLVVGLIVLVILLCYACWPCGWSTLYQVVFKLANHAWYLMNNTLTRYLIFLKQPIQRFFLFFVVFFLALFVFSKFREFIE